MTSIYNLKIQIDDLDREEIEGNGGDDVWTATLSDLTGPVTTAGSGLGKTPLEALIDLARELDFEEVSA